MIDMKQGDSTIYPTMRIAQWNIGELEISAMAFSSSLSSQPISFYHAIEIRDASQFTEGWGKSIFKGTLAELITLVREANLLKVKEAAMLDLNKATVELTNKEIRDYVNQTTLRGQ